MFDPTNYEFAFNLSKHNCFKKLTGKCSLLLTDRQLRKYQKIDTSNKNSFNSVHYCRKLLDYIKLNGMPLPVISIEKKTCGHFSVIDGQHRICIAKTSGLNQVTATTSTSVESECAVCRNKDSSFSYRIKQRLGRTREYIR